MIRSCAVAAVLALAAGGGSVRQQPPVAAGLTAPPAPVHYQAPAPAPLRVLRAFDPPADPYGPGHLGVDLAAGRHALVRAAGPGVVHFAGPVAGRGVVVLQHADGIRTEYEPVRPLIPAGAVVRAGDPIGRIEGQHAGCAPRSCLHWGARRGETYVDPMSLLRPLGAVRLLPWPRDA